MPSRSLLFVLSALSILLFACSSAPPTPPSARHFADAKNNLQASDYKAALENLDATIKTTSDDTVRQQASLLRVALLTALADADQQIAEAYHLGAKQPPAQAQTGAFYNERSDYNNAARNYLMDAMQAELDQRGKLGPNPIAIQITYPGFTGGVDPGLAKIKSGILISDNERANTELQMDRNAFATILAALAGVNQDLNKGRELFDAGKVDVDSRVYLVAFSDSFLNIGAMFDTRGINEPDKFRTVNQVVRGNLDIAEKLLAAKPDKELESRVKKMEGDCDKCLKKLGA
ncbi:MAG TPA: hypothetical protein VMU53_16070 [Candidatus Sulfotelmatobacter sp.]|nr:hypothetical protein [Candidatus Sulfotelmatobacter sp.]